LVAGTLIWKISDYTSKLAEAKTKEGMELLSPPFYTSQYGYKLQVDTLNEIVLIF
jgi:TNF receptor-associated factor 4